jgi:acyl-CoA thioesterase-2
MAKELEALISAFHLERLEDDSYLGPRLERNLPRVFGGLVLGQAIVAAAKSTDSRYVPHSCHAYFMRGGDPQEPIIYGVERMHDGRSFCTRRVRATQGSRLLFEMSASFHAVEQGLDFDRVQTASAGPHASTAWEDWAAATEVPLPSWWTTPGPFEVRFAERPIGLIGGASQPPRQVAWMRPRGEVPFEPVISAALLAFASDLHLLAVMLMPHGRAWTGPGAVLGASLDHAMWFHRSTVWTDWVECVQESDITRAARGLAHCTFRSPSGEVLATAAQEGLLRVEELAQGD